MSKRRVSQRDWRLFYSWAMKAMQLGRALRHSFLIWQRCGSVSDWEKANPKTALCRQGSPLKFLVVQFHLLFEG